MEEYNPPEVTEYGPVTAITGAEGTNKKGDGDDEYSNGNNLTGTVF